MDLAVHRAALALLLGLVLAVTRLPAAETPPGDASHVGAVVQQQLDALAAGDAQRAFDLAAPGVRELFGTPERFLAMVKAHYPMVVRPASVRLLPPEADGDAMVQRVELRDAAGAAWRVTYLLHRQKDGHWRISACIAAPDAHRLMT
ncbi:MAG TPA: DUF4864 domain-containing protein [Ramlibacter sp.]|nr:DUF4864 domain-containing protein [Ramlibacter sp.]